MTIEWIDRYNIGDVQIKQPHRRRFALVNQVLRASDWALFLIPHEDVLLADYLNYCDTRRADLSTD